MNTTAARAISSLKAEIVALQVAIAETRERGSQMAEQTRLNKIAELRADIAFCERNAHQPEEWWTAA